MALSPEMVAAHEQLEAAIEAMLQVGESFDAGTITTGYTLIVAGMSFDDEPEPDADEQDAVSHHCAFFKRGQSPHLTRGMVESFIDQMREANR